MKTLRTVRRVRGVEVERRALRLDPSHPRSGGSAGQDLALLASASQPLGLGDAVELVAKPIARVLDRVLGTRISGCGACAKRRRRLNALVPDVRLKR